MNIFIKILVFALSAFFLTNITSVLLYSKDRSETEKVVYMVYFAELIGIFVLIFAK